MPSPFIVCASCRCHVKSAARSCPLCHANLNRPGALRLLQAARKVVRRQVVVAAIAGLGAGCGTTTLQPPGGSNQNLGSGNPSFAVQADSGAKDSGPSESVDSGTGTDSGAEDSGTPVDSGVADSGAPIDYCPADAGSNADWWTCGSCTDESSCSTPKDGGFAACNCGWGGLCNQQTGQCENCGCDAGYWCNGTYGNCSYHTCYGAPPLMAAES